MQRNTHPLILFILALLLLASCAQPPAATEPPAQSGSPIEPPAVEGLLNGSSWMLDAYLVENGGMQPVAPGSQITLEFTGEQAGGSAGCNSYGGSYTLDGSRLSFGMLASTMMACEEPRMAQESAYLAALGKTASYRIEAEQLTLLDAAGQVILIFHAGAPSAAAPAEPGVSQPAGDVVSSSDSAQLTGIVWKWVEAIESSGKQVAPVDPAQYTLQFNSDGSLKVQADCNLGTGGYTLDGSKLTIHVGILTLATCDKGSLSAQFIQYLNNAGSFFFQDGALYIEIMYDSGSLKFTP